MIFVATLCGIGVMSYKMYMDQHVINEVVTILKQWCQDYRTLGQGHALLDKYKNWLVVWDGRTMYIKTQLLRIAVQTEEVLRARVCLCHSIDWKAVKVLSGLKIGSIERELIFQRFL